MNQIFAELRRRNVFRVAAAYLVVGWLVMQVVATIGSAAGLPDWSDSFALILLITGFPIVLFIAWAFELTPEGMKKTADSDGPVAAKPLGMSDYLLVAAVVAVLGVAGLQAMLGRADAPDVVAETEIDEPEAPVETVPVPSDLSIAVLPFADLSATGDQAYFGDGMAEDILNLLAQIEAMDVTSRTSAFRYRGDAYSIPEIAAALNVRHILEGSVRKDGEVVRITAQLIDASGDRHLWSQTFDRPSTAGAVFAVQDEISTAIVAALSDELGIEVAAPETANPVTDDLDAYELYLQARALINARVDLDQADAYLARAIEQDIEFDSAWSLRSILPWLRREYGYSELAPDETDILTLDYVDRALSLEPRSATALAARGKMRMNANRDLRGEPNDWAMIIADFDAALAIDPDDPAALNWRGLAWRSLGRIEQAMQDFQACQRAEPMNSPCWVNACYISAERGDHESAIDCHQAGLARGVVNDPLLMVESMAMVGNRYAFLTAVNAPGALPGWDRYDDLYNALRAPGEDHSELRRALQQKLDQLPEIAFFGGIELYNTLGGENPGQVGFGWGAGQVNLRRSAAFADFVRGSGILAYWQEYGFPAQCRPVPAQGEGDDGFECD
jgi:TolB-like protein